MSRGVTALWLSFKMSSFPIVFSQKVRREFLKT
jgi:hypothetical protein